MYLNEKEQRCFSTADTGRTHLYKQDPLHFNDLVIHLGAQGYSRVQIAAAIGISIQTLYDWRKEFPQFNAAMDIAITKAQAWWEGRAMDGQANTIIGQGIWSKSMAARFPSEYADRKEVGDIGDAARITEVRRTIIRPPAATPVEVHEDVLDDDEEVY